jgi:hypothetical protein
MFYDVVRAIFWAFIALLIIGAILSSVLKINIATEIANYGLKHTIERIWNGPEQTR